MPIFEHHRRRRSAVLWALVGHTRSELIRVPGRCPAAEDASRRLLIEWGLESSSSPELPLPAGFLKGVGAVNLVLPPGIAWFADLELPGATPRAAVAHRLAESMAARAYTSPDHLAIDYRAHQNGRGYSVVAAPRATISRAAGLLAPLSLPVRRVVPAPAAADGECARFADIDSDAFNLLPWRRELAVRRGALALASSGLTALVVLLGTVLALYREPLPAIADMRHMIGELDTDPGQGPAVSTLSNSALAGLRAQLEQQWLAARTRGRWVRQWADIHDLVDSGLAVSALSWSPVGTVLTGSYSGNEVPARLQAMVDKPWWPVPSVEQSPAMSGKPGSVSATWTFRNDSGEPTLE